MIILCFDTETTGLDQQRDRIIEFAAVAYDTTRSEIIFTEDVLIDPMRPIPEEASKINHITDQMIKDEAVGRWVLYGPRARTLIKRADVLVGQNIEFDINMLSSEMARTGDVFPQKPSIDTLIMARRFYPNDTIKSKRLSKLAEFLNVPLSEHDAHRALPDTIATLNVFLKMLQDLDITIENVLDPNFNKIGKYMIGMDPFEAMIAGLPFAKGE